MAASIDSTQKKMLHFVTIHKPPYLIERCCDSARNRGFLDYRLALKNCIDTTYDDSWAAFQWVLSHVNGEGPDSWLNNHADLTKLFIGGESAGANIANDVAVRAGVELDSKI
ncbi:hypothetical protein HAX54_037309 [Datura stramonium]|uniref:Alpha/beta hydrolase fold-3 domain-containing protein n=1 Tax=Datura stramonium TaxID=4076 RepID=A0ABS8RGV3_DATST|nr:hypothetical protein [Datura stramonium]